MDNLMGRLAGGRFGEVTNEENAAVVNLRQAGETIEKRARLGSLRSTFRPVI